MTHFKRALIVFGTVAAMSVSGVATFAATWNTPAEAVAGITGRTTEDVIDERVSSGKTYGTIANEAGKLSEFQEAMLEIQKERLSSVVSNGGITQEQADAALDNIQQNQAICNGTGVGAGGGFCGFGGMGGGMGCGMGGGVGRGMGGGRGRW